MNSGIKSLVLAAGKHGVNLSVDRLVHDHELDESELDLSGLVGIANKNSLKAKSIRADREAIRQLDTALPVIAQLDNGHYVVIAGYLDAEPEGESGSIQFIDPLAVKPRVEEIDLNRFLQRWNGHLVLLKSNYSLADDDQPLSRRWIVQALSKQKLLMAQLVAISLLLHIFGFLPIIYIMTVLDKVVNYEAYSTLYVIASGIIVAHIFNAVFGYMRRYIALFVTSKIEVRLNSWVFSHMLDLPLDYFHNNDSSRVVKTVQQVATIRQFLVNKLFGTVLDSTALLIFIPILILYSPLLFSIVFVFALLIAFNNAFFSRRQKEVMQTVNAQETQKQSTLLHSVSGIEMVKSLTLETAQKRKWDEYAASHTLANMELGKVNAASSQIGSMLQQIMTVVVIFVGVLLVFDGELSPGVLIGVNMLAGKITGPLVALATMSAETEKLSMAISMLSSITDRKGEYRRAGLVPEIKGGIEFQGVGFSYKEDQQLLQDVSFEIKPRQRIAIVGVPGCGKSTLVRMIQGMTTPQEGAVIIDGQDVRSLDLAHLRINVSLVGTENSFFNETIRENITKPMPGAPIERVIWASKLAGLHSMVSDLSDGYETVLEEGGSNLSTVQRQKIALARGLIRNPRILILDEVFTNLGVEDELNLMNNLDEINQGRTLIIISHRIAHIISSDHILVLDSGRVAESGSHTDLIQSDGLYAGLWEKEMTLNGVKC